MAKKSFRRNRGYKPRVNNSISKIHVRIRNAGDFLERLQSTRDQVFATNSEPTTLPEYQDIMRRAVTKPFTL